MAILLYCVAKVDAPAIAATTGVAGDSVVRVALGSIAAFVSNAADKSNWLRPQLQASALEFHLVLSKLFSSSAIIPFRFPTVFENEEQLIQCLQERSSEYVAVLEKFRDLVQMEIRVMHRFPETPAESGKQYLKLRQTAAAVIDKFVTELRLTLSAVSKDWRQRTAKDGIRAFALVDRKQTDDFKNQLGDAKVPNELSVRASGPWPVSEFIERE